ncbi:MAG: TonB-dependent receptor [Blastocatellia bacterium]|nr:TonB-dependent receptor [Blastocatellia bacterium]
MIKLTLRISSFLLLFALVSLGSQAQTSTTGAVTGQVTDAAGAVVPGVNITITNQATGESRTAVTTAEGTYRIPQLPPGRYRIEATRAGFKSVDSGDLRINVTETLTFPVQMQVGAVDERVSVVADEAQVQTESSALGRVIDERTITSLPLVTRNFTQILALSPGVISNVTDASGLGRGLGGITTGGQQSGGGQDSSSHGARVYENGFSMNGVPVNDTAGSGTVSGGAPIPNPDTIQEFKVQTGQFDAAFGRNSGANVNIVTKGGSNQFHGTAYEFFRNDVLNANLFFFNRARQRKPVLAQNQFGGTLGGPIKKDKLFFFGSYQGTRQRNGVAGGCSTTFFSPPLTDDRSRAALGALFAGQRGQNGGVAIAADGSNIHPVALRLLQMKNADGTYLISTPQTIEPSRPFAQRGFSAVSKPCTYDEDQFMTNADFLHTEKSKFAGRFFFASATTFVPLAAGSQAEGFGQRQPEDFRSFSLTHSYTISPRVFNEVQFGFHSTDSFQQPVAPFKLSDIGITPGYRNDDLPSIRITGAQQLRAGSPQHWVQKTFVLQDSLSWVAGQHAFRFGGGATRTRIDYIDFRQPAIITINTFADFLLGLDAARNGTQFSNIFSVNEILGSADRKFRVWDGFAYAQDDLKLSQRLTLNLGLRYERIGAFGDELGRNAVFDTTLANPNPPAGGTIQGWVVASNFATTIPAGLTQFRSSSGTNAVGQNNLAPRVGFAWKALPKSDRIVLRGGYGMYYGHLIGQQVVQEAFIPPFAESRAPSGVLNAASTLDKPFPATPAASDYPKFPIYSPTTAITTRTLDKNLRSSITQHFSLNAQTRLAKDYLVEIGYVGARGTKLLRTRSLNQALLASAASPIRGATTNTVANIQQRVPFQGWAAGSIQNIESGGASWYNGLEASVNKRFSRGLQFLASYTWSKALDTDGGNLDGTSVGVANTLGNQNNPQLRYGQTNFHRPHRFVISYVYELPGPTDRNSLPGRVLGGWSLSGVTTIQTGQTLSLTGINNNNVFGITGDFAPLTASCAHSQLVASGAVKDKLGSYFNASCIQRNAAGAAAWPIIGDDGRATSFGSAGAGIVRGPGQNNFDLALLKRTTIRESVNAEFRAEFFNAFNTPQFGLPVTSVTNPAFGTITTTSVNPRVIQLALKLNF